MESVKQNMKSPLHLQVFSGRLKFWKKLSIGDLFTSKVKKPLYISVIIGRINLSGEWYRYCITFLSDEAVTETSNVHQNCSEGSGVEPSMWNPVMVAVCVNLYDHVTKPLPAACN